MTFILTELSEFGITMAADSSETITNANGRRDFLEVDKIIYFKKLNIGISTWGDARIESIDINTWLENEINKFIDNISSNSSLKNKYLKEVAEYLARRLNEDSSNMVCGLHVAGYSYVDGKYKPGIFHVHNHDKANISEIKRCIVETHRNGVNPELFIAEPTKPILEDGNTVHVRNGIYEKFALFFPAYSGLQRTFVDTIQLSYPQLRQENLDLVKIEAENIANWVRLMCNTFSEAGLAPFVGKKVRVLVILPNKYRKFTLNEFAEEEW